MTPNGINWACIYFLILFNIKNPRKYQNKFFIVLLSRLHSSVFTRNMRGDSSGDRRRIRKSKFILSASAVSEGVAVAIVSSLILIIGMRRIFDFESGFFYYKYKKLFSSQRSHIISMSDI
jgi:hypothetical protein